MKTTRKLSALTLAIASLGPLSTLHAEQVDSISAMLSKGETDLSFRYRYEYVDQDGIDKTAGASTLKTRLSYKSAAYKGFGFVVEMDDVTVVGNENYRTPTNGNTQYPIVADPSGTDVNQVLISYTNDHLSSALGRQRINHAGQRFVGGVGWRQNEQTYDAISFKLPKDAMLSLDYSYITKVNRIFGPENSTVQANSWDSDSHALIATVKPADNHSISAFAYILDFENAAANSSSTYGLEYKGKIGMLSLAASYATQSDNGDNTSSYAADYMSAAVGIALAPINLSVGYELLGSDDGDAAFRTPLATLHKFNGWADQFLGTPATGLEDMYVKVAGKLGKTKMAVVYHQFDADEGSIDYGSEINFVATYPFSKNISAQFKYAAYDAEEFKSDTDKVWLTMNLKF
ncbi:MAG: hypothetical protein ACJAYG_000609 [Oceanicoccus sp.]|jgi:hypothetical protein